DAPPALRTDYQLMSEDEVKDIKTGLSAMKRGAVLDIFSKEDITGKEKSWLVIVMILILQHKKQLKTSKILLM
uniref:Uncharacterized protein n=1 Tax=Amphimedon queenslandica TaxID=400682 RepID=A0A1X7ULI9_AMPQE